MKKNGNDILIFKTNIQTQGDLETLQSVLDRHRHIHNWSIDFDDDDRVFRIISSGIDHSNIIEMVKLNGYHCEELKD